MEAEMDMEAAQHHAAERLRWHDAGLHGAGVSQGVASDIQRTGAAWSTTSTSNLLQQRGQQTLNTPHVDAVMVSYYERQGGMQPANQQQQLLHRQPMNWQQQQQGGRRPEQQQGGRRPEQQQGGRRPARAAWDSSGGDSQRTDQLALTTIPGSVSGGGKVYIVDAAVQTMDTYSALVRQLQTESALLKEQMIKLTGEVMP
jgi:hypothetical protein